MLTTQRKTLILGILRRDPDIRWQEIWLFVVLDYWMDRNSIS